MEPELYDKEFENKIHTCIQDLLDVLKKYDISIGLTAMTHLLVSNTTIPKKELVTILEKTWDSWNKDM